MKLPNTYMSELDKYMSFLQALVKTKKAINIYSMDFILLNEGVNILKYGCIYNVIKEQDLEELTFCIKDAISAYENDQISLQECITASINRVIVIIERFVIDDYDHFSQRYNILDSFSHKYFFSFATPIIFSMLNELKASNNEMSLKIVDIGTGIGYPSLLIGATVNNVTVYGTDISGGQLYHARKYLNINNWGNDPYTITGIMSQVKGEYKASETTLLQNVHLIRASTLPLKSNSINFCIMSSSVASYSPRAKMLLSDISRVLTRNGRALISFSYFSYPRLFLLIKTEGVRRALKYWRQGYHASVIPVKVVENSDKITLNYKLSLKKSIIKTILEDVGLEIINIRSLYPVIYAKVSLISKVRIGDDMPSAYTSLRRPASTFQSIIYFILTRIDTFLSRFPFLGYELWYEVKKK